MEEICSMKSCTGCMACFNICPNSAIEMKMNEKGFFYPYINLDLCSDCGMCKKKCPVNFRAKRNDSIEKEVFAMWSLDDSIRYESSSGGAFSELAKVILNDGGVVFGAYWNDEIKVVHGKISSICELHKLRKSKYVQSSIWNTYNDVLKYIKNGKKILFCGTPCQIVGLLNVIPDNLKENLYTIDIFCFGAASPGVFEEYKSFLENKYKKKILKIDLRTKITGWKKYVMSISFEDGTKIIKPQHTSLWLNDFKKALTVRESCQNCNYNNINRIGDISLGDYWNFSPLNKFEPDDDRGISCIIVNSEKGKKLFEAIKGKTHISARSINDILLKQKRALGSEQLPVSDYNEFWKLYSKEGFYNTSKKFIDGGEESAWKAAIKYQTAIDWLMMKQKGISIISYFEKKELKNIAIYGMGEFGLLLCNELENEDINIVFTMDSERILPYNDIPVISMSQLKEMEDVDAIIVTPVFAYNKIKKQLEKIVDYPIISLEEIVKYNK